LIGVKGLDSLFFILSKVFWVIVSPGNMLYLLLLLILFFVWRGNIKLVNRFLFALLFITTLITFIPLGDYLLKPLEQQYSISPKIPDQLTGIIVLGGAINARASNLIGQIQMGGSAERDFTFMRLAKQYPFAKLVYAGGSGELMNQQDKESLVAMKFFSEQGFDTKRILFESNSRNTYENILFSKKLVNPAKGDKWLLITSASHMPRAVGVFNKLNWPIIPYPVDYKVVTDKLFTFNFSGNLSRLEHAVKEWLGIFAYKITEKVG
jgi:uncharacterized SAM-binding protein YcdF (DUF218 family)